jgi:hypothetical protein
MPRTFGLWIAFTCWGAVFAMSASPPAGPIGTIEIVEEQ